MDFKTVFDFKKRNFNSTESKSEFTRHDRFFNGVQLYIEVYYFDSTNYLNKGTRLVEMVDTSDLKSDFIKKYWFKSNNE